jgi:hypothetical protein
MSSEDDNPNDRDVLIRDAWRRLTRLEMEAHRIKAMLARMEAMDQDRAADALARLLAEHPDDLGFASALRSYFEEPFSAATAAHAIPPELPHASPPVAESIAPREYSFVSDITPEQPPTEPPPATTLIRIDSDGRTSKRRRIVESPPIAESQQGVAALGVNADAALTSKAAVRRTPESLPVRRRIPAWVTSVVTHGIMLLVLAMFSIVTLEEDEPWLAATIGEPDETAVAELSEVEIAHADSEMSETDPVDPAPLDAALSEIEPLLPDALGGAADVMASTDVGEFALAELPLGTAGMLEASGGNGGGNGGEGDLAGLPTTSFFGAEARASRIVFLVDNSNSMDEGRFETALLELARSVDALSPQQSFYVLLYSDTAYPLFHPQSADALVPATVENKERLRNWLSTAELCVGGRLVDAFKIAADLQPQVVYLLSDGVISEFPVSYLTEQRDWTFTVHTIGMTVPDQQAAQNMMSIAAANRGSFRPVGVTPIALEMARRRPIKKNRTRGRVWGIKLPANAPM